MAYTHTHHNTPYIPPSGPLVDDTTRCTSDEREARARCTGAVREARARCASAPATSARHGRGAPMPPREHLIHQMCPPALRNAGRQCVSAFPPPPPCCSPICIPMPNPHIIYERADRIREESQWRWSSPRGEDVRMLSLAAVTLPLTSLVHTFATRLLPPPPWRTSCYSSGWRAVCGGRRRSQLDRVAAAAPTAAAAPPLTAAARAAPLALPGLHRGAALAVRSLVCYIYPVPCACTSW